MGIVTLSRSRPENGQIRLEPKPGINDLAVEEARKSTAKQEPVSGWEVKLR